MKQPRFCQLTTPFETGPSNAWEEYPRPQLRRSSYQSLCGLWDLKVERNGASQPLGQIRVPFPPESRLSGIGRTLEQGERYRYERTFTLEEPIKGGRILLHFGAVDQLARVFLNEMAAGEHEGGYLPFTLDVTELVREGENTLTVEVTDDLDTELSYGKQRRDRGGMWYTPISGIWQPVWLERVSADYVRTLRLTPGLDHVLVETTGGGEEKTLTLHLPEGDVEHSWKGDRAVIPVERPILWTPENPHLYTFTLETGEDRLESYFALRTVTVEQRKGRAWICLNGEPMFFHGLLDQGYFSDGIYLPATPEGLEWDVLIAKSLGFNVLRKHIKIEPDLFYYYCDKHGMVVFQDMLNTGTYHYLIDTVFPTLGMKRGVTHRPSARRKAHFEAACRETVQLLYNHPCVCYYTVFNEGWGQYDADRIYRDMKELDPSRVWDATSGWFFERDSDVTSEHTYFRKLKLKGRADRPLVLSEFGGYSCKIPEHSFNLDQTYGYKKFDDLRDFRRDLERLYREEVMPAISNGLCATVLTQFSDVEDETNGLVTYDRQVIKADRERMAQLGRDLQQALRSQTEE